MVNVLDDKILLNKNVFDDFSWIVIYVDEYGNEASQDLCRRSNITFQSHFMHIPIIYMYYCIFQTIVLIFVSGCFFSCQESTKFSLFALRKWLPAIQCRFAIIYLKLENSQPKFGLANPDITPCWLGIFFFILPTAKYFPQYFFWTIGKAAPILEGNCAMFEGK